MRFDEKLLGQLTRVIDGVLERGQRVLLSMMNLTFVAEGVRADLAVVRGLQARVLVTEDGRGGRRRRRRLAKTLGMRGIQRELREE